MSYHTSGKTGFTEIFYLISCESTKFPDYWWKTDKQNYLTQTYFHRLRKLAYNGGISYVWHCYKYDLQWFWFKLCKAFNPVRPGEGGGSEARMLKIKVNINRLKWNCMSHYSHKSIPDAKFEADSSSSFGDMTPQNFFRKKGMSHQIRLFSPRKMGLTLKKWVFMSRIVLLDPELTPHVNLKTFQTEEIFFIFKIFGTSHWEKSSNTPPPPPWLINFAKVWSERVLRKN